MVRAVSSCGLAWAWRSACRGRKWTTSGTCCRRPAYLRIVRMVLQVEAMGAGLRLVTHRVVCAEVHQQRIESFPLQLPLDPAGGLTNSRAGWRKGPRATWSTGCRSCRSTGTTVGTQRMGLRGARLQAGDALGHDRHDLRCLPRLASPRSAAGARRDSTTCASGPGPLSRGRGPLNDTGAAILGWWMAAQRGRYRRVLSEQYNGAGSVSRPRSSTT